MIDLDAIRRRREAADDTKISVSINLSARKGANVDVRGYADFLSYAAADIDALIAEVERLREALTGLIATRDTIGAYIDTVRESREPDAAWRCYDDRQFSLQLSALFDKAQAALAPPAAAQERGDG